MPRDKDKIPDELSPKDIALFLMLRNVNAARSSALEMSAEQIEELAHELGWVQYTCTPRKLALIKDQIEKAADRATNLLEEPLKKRHIL